MFIKYTQLPIDGLFSFRFAVLCTLPTGVQVLVDSIAQVWVQRFDDCLDPEEMQMVSSHVEL